MSEEVKGSHLILRGECLQIMATLEAGSIDAIITDLPYGTTACKWDSVIPFAPMWFMVRRVLKPNGVFVTTASQPFTSALVMSNPRDFRYCWVWEKSVGTGFLDAKKKPLRCHEDVAVFYREQPTYNPQKWQGEKNHGCKTNVRKTKSVHAGEYGRPEPDLSGMKYPRSVVKFSKHSASENLHPTQKPLELMRYLVRTYTNPGDTVLDPCCGSGTTGVAAQLEGRNCVLIERDEKYLEITHKRLLANKEVSR